MTRTHRRGLAALATIVLVLFLIVGLVVAMGQFGSSAREFQTQSHEVRSANEAALAAQQIALLRLSQKATWDPAKDDITRAEFNALERV